MKYALVVTAMAAVLGGLGASSATAAPSPGAGAELCIMDENDC